MSPRSSDADALRTRERIVQATVDRASELGLEGVTVRELAGDLGMSKSGVIAPFASRGELLELAFERAVGVFRAEVIEPVLGRPAGPRRLRALLDGWIEHLVRSPFPGGCFVTTASVEFDNREGVLRERTVAAVEQWLRFLTDEARTARPDANIAAARVLATTVNGIAMAVNQEVQLLGDPRAGVRGRRAMRTAVDAFLA